MADLFATGIQIPDLTSGQARPADVGGFLRVFSRNQFLYGLDENGNEFPLSAAEAQTIVEQGDGITVTVDGVTYTVTNADRGSVAVTAHEAAEDPHPQYTTTEEAAAAAPVQSVNGDVGAVRVNFIEAPAGATTPANVIASDNSISFNFNNEPRAVYRTGGVDFFSNNGSPYSYRFRDISGNSFAGLRAPDSVPSAYFSKLPSAIGEAGQVLAVQSVTGNQQALGYLTPSHPIDLYNSNGLISKDVRIKQWVGVVQSDANGDFTVDWSAAGFTQPPFSVMVTAFSPVTGTVRDRAWATMRTGFTATQGQGYTLRGNLLVFVLGGGGETVRTAPNVPVHVVAWGV